MSDSQRFPVAAHVLAYLAHKDALTAASAVSSNELAASVATNPVVVRRVTANTFNDVFGVTRNPWNPALSPAGSSGGSAVAVATGMVPLAQGTDFGCSIRMPASFCGIVGIRPTPGLTPNWPMPLAWDPGQVHGPLARTAEDAGQLVSARENYFTAAVHWGAAQWPIAENNATNLRYNERKVACYSQYARLADHHVERVSVSHSRSQGSSRQYATAQLST